MWTVAGRFMTVWTGLRVYSPCLFGVAGGKGHFQPDIQAGLHLDV